MNSLIISTILAGFTWIISLFFLLSVILINNMENKLTNILHDSEDCEKVINFFYIRKKIFQKYFYITAFVGIFLYILPEL